MPGNLHSTVTDSGTGNSIVYANGQVWVAWNRVYMTTGSGGTGDCINFSGDTAGATCTVSASSGSVWRAWNNQYVLVHGASTSNTYQVSGPALPPPSAEQVEARRRREEEIRVQQDQILKDQKVAKKRARVLLLRHLTPEQRRAMKRSGHFKVLAQSGNMYIIETTHGQARNVKQVSKEGRVLKTLCAHPESHVPDEDAFLAQKLLLESAEQEFLRVANVS